MLGKDWPDFDLGPKTVAYLIAGVVTGLFILVFSYLSGWVIGWFPGFISVGRRLAG
jgi:hypothetical protein